MPVLTNKITHSDDHRDYKMFFNHVNKPMKIMAELINNGRYADEIMEIYRKDGEEAENPAVKTLMN